MIVNSLVLFIFNFSPQMVSFITTPIKPNTRGIVNSLACLRNSSRACHKFVITSWFQKGWYEDIVIIQVILVPKGVGVKT